DSRSSTPNPEPARSGPAAPTGRRTGSAHTDPTRGGPVLILAIDTAAAASVALVDGERRVAARTAFAAPRHVELTGPALAEVLAEAPRPDAVVVGLGPGPFTGLRAGIAAGIGAALGAGVPVHGVVSHDALALRALSTP